MERITLNIAEVETTFRFKYKDSNFFKYLNNKYSDFFADKKSKNIIRVEFSDSVFRNDDKVYLKEDEKLIISRKDFLFEDGNLFIKPNIYSFDSFLRIYISNELNKSKGLLIHSSGFIFNNRAFIFVSKSGGGKSAIIKIFGDYKAFSDELIPLVFKENQWFVFSSPFWGEIRRRKSKPFKAKLNKIFFIKKDFRNFELKISKNNGFYELMRCVMNFNPSKKLANLISDKIISLLNCDFSILHFSKSKSLVSYFKNIN